VVEKSPDEVGVRTCSSLPVSTVTTASKAVFPEMLIIFFETTSSSVGWSTIKNIDGFGVGVGIGDETVLVFFCGVFFVFSYRKKTTPATRSPMNTAKIDSKTLSVFMAFKFKAKTCSCQEKTAMVGCIIVDVFTINNTSIKIRFRRVSFVIDPPGDGGKTNCDAVVLFNSAAKDLSKVADYRIVINGPGEYEISGVKVSGIGVDGGFVYNIIGDSMGVFLGKAKEISKIKDKLNIESQIVIINVDSEFAESALTEFDPKVVVLYGEKKTIGAKTMGKENTTDTKKFTITKDKLPEGMEIVMLG
jgi:hypothetical protein